MHASGVAGVVANVVVGEAVVVVWEAPVVVPVVVGVDDVGLSVPVGISKVGNSIIILIPMAGDSVARGIEKAVPEAVAVAGGVSAGGGEHQHYDENCEGPHFD